MVNKQTQTAESALDVRWKPTFALHPQSRQDVQAVYVVHGKRYLTNASPFGASAVRHKIPGNIVLARDD